MGTDLPTSPVVKKAVKIDLSGKQAFVHKKDDLDPEIVALASTSLAGNVVKASTATAEAENTSSDIRETTPVSAAEAEEIKEIVKQADEAGSVDALTKVNLESKAQIEALTAEIHEKDILVKKAAALTEHNVEQFSQFVAIVDTLLEGLPVERVEEFLESDDAEVYKTIVKKYKDS